MTAPSLQSPNTGNYFVGKGMVQFKPEGESVYFYMGNCPSFEFEPSLETLEHFSSMAGVKAKDVTVVLSKGGTLTMQLEELTARNLALFLLGDVDVTDPLNPTVEIFASELKSGAVRFIGTNEVGPRWTFEFNKVDFVPSGSFNPISEEWGSLEVTGNLATADGSFGLARLTNLQADTLPVNLGLPEITGNLVVGETLSAFEGVWAGAAITYAYQWQADGVDIAAATASTFVLTTAQNGSMITVEVDATNASGGPIQAESPAQGPVVEVSA